MEGNDGSVAEMSFYVRLLLWQRQVLRLARKEFGGLSLSSSKGRRVLLRAVYSPPIDIELLRQENLHGGEEAFRLQLLALADDGGEGFT